jgi:hypothetical protein
MKGVGGMDVSRYEVIDFDKVFDVLKRMRYVHDEDEVITACFKDWNEGGDSGDYNEKLGYLIRFILMSEAIEFSKRLGQVDCDMRDILFFLVVKGMGLNLLSQVVEAAERGLGVLYGEKDYEALKVCFEMMLKSLEKKLGEIEEMKEVELQ